MPRGRLATGIVLLFLFVGSACGGSKRPPALPLMPTTAPPGSVAQFPCPMHPSTTLAMETCSARSVLALDRRIDKVMRTIWSRLRDRTARAAFATAERAWQTYVQEECTSVSGAYTDAASPHQYVGGTSAAVNYPLCELRLGDSHLRELRQTAAGLAPR
jgi:uncharacterized protein YecT (DUF1311 family)